MGLDTWSWHDIPGVAVIDHADPHVADQIYELQQAAYTVERDLIDYPDFPPLQVTAAEIQQEQETFLGSWDGDRLVGVLSFAVTPPQLHIGRLIVHPAQFRRGIASALLHAFESGAPAGSRLTVSTAEKNIPGVRLYQKHGYHRTHRSVVGDGLGLVWFLKVRHEGSPMARPAALPQDT